MSYNKVEWLGVWKFSQFKYLGCIINRPNHNLTDPEIQGWLKNANRCYYAMNTLFSSKIFSLKTKLKCYKAILEPIILYSAET